MKEGEVKFEKSKNISQLIMLIKPLEICLKVLIASQTEDLEEIKKQTSDILKMLKYLFPVEAGQGYQNINIPYSLLQSFVEISLLLDDGYISEGAPCFQNFYKLFNIVGN